MVNPLIYVGVKIDNAVNEGIDYLIKGWNWTTGGTKTDLAETLLVGFPSLTFFQGIKDFSPIMFVGGTIFSICNFGFSKIYRNIEKREENANNHNCKDLQTESIKKSCHNLGYGYHANGAIMSLAEYNYFGLGSILQGISIQVIGSNENPKKRDNCLKRAKTYIDNLKREPAYVQKNNLEGLV